MIASIVHPGHQLAYYCTRTHGLCFDVEEYYVFECALIESAHENGGMTSRTRKNVIQMRENGRSRCG
jgi:hypothetical protein